MTTPTIDTSQFLTQLVTTARGNMQAQESMVAMGMISPQSATTHKAAKDALDEARSAMSQPNFFTALDALGGQEAVIEQIVGRLATPDSTSQYHQCAYCDTELDGPEPDHAPPTVDDDAGWQALATLHADWCEWIATRAHRIEA